MVLSILLLHFSNQVYHFPFDMPIYFHSNIRLFTQAFPLIFKIKGTASTFRAQRKKRYTVIYHYIGLCNANKMLDHHLIKVELLNCCNAAIYEFRFFFLQHFHFYESITLPSHSSPYNPHRNLAQTLQKCCRTCV